MCLRPNVWLPKNENMLVRVDGKLGKGVTPKDVVLAIIAKIGTAGDRLCHRIWRTGVL